jgi:parallel beta-helix repeat protein
MRKFYFFSLLIVVPLFLNAQPWRKNLPANSKKNYTFFDYQNAFNDYWESYNVGPDGKYIDKDGVKRRAPGYKQFKRWEWYWAPRVDHNTGAFPEKPAFEIWHEYKSVKGTKSVGGTWTSIGDQKLDPLDEPSLQESGTGRINCAAFDPNDNNHFWVGAPSGGLWESKDGGLSWTCKTDNELILGVSDIALSPNYSSDKTIYIATGDRDAGDDPSLGVLKSTDDGVTWYRTDLKFKAGSSSQAVRVIVDPGDENTIYAATSVGFYKSTDAGITFTLKQSGNFIDMDMIPGSESGTGGADLIATTQTASAQAWRSTDAGENWAVVLTANAANEDRMDIAVTPANANYVYVITGWDGGAIGEIYRSTNGGATFSSVYNGASENNLFGWDETNTRVDGGQAFYDVAIAVSSDDENEVYVGGVNAYISTNGATSFILANQWDPAAGGGTSMDEVHADHHNAYYRPSDHRLFDCNDGGFYYSDTPETPANGNWIGITDGLVTGQLYDIGVSQTEPGSVIAGYQDNGGKYRDISTSATDWEQIREGDGMESEIDPTNVNNQWTSYPTGYVFRTTDEWASGYTNLRTTADAAWSFPIEADPQGNSTVYIGAQGVERYVGTTKTILGTLGAYLLSMDVYNDGSNLVIWTGSSSDLWKSGTSGTSYTSVYSGLPGNQVMDIAIDDDDYTHVYVSLGGYDYNVVYETTDGGSTWTDISSGLPPVPAGAIVINEQNTTEHELYVGTDLGVFVKVGTDNWRLFNDGFPVVSITELEIYYDATPENSKLYAGTYGRDTWVSDMFAIPATPMTYTSSTVFQNDPYDVFQGTVKNEIIGIEVEVSGSISPLDITSFSFNTTGSTDAANDISNAKLYYTGTSNVFGTTTQFGSTANAPNGNFSVTGTQILTCGKNYFWLTYDIDASATIGDYIDAECTSITVGTVKTPTVTAPIGNRQIGTGSYCSTTSTDDFDCGISNVTFNTINNTTTALTADRYNDYTATSTSVDAGSTYNLSTTIVSGSNTFYTSAWVDWNHDYDFDDPGETISLGAGASNTANVDVTIPVDAVGGNALMRVSTTFDSPITPCGEYRYGETEDYTVDVTPLLPPSIASATPNSGTSYKDGGKDISITGTDLSDATSVTVAGVDAIIVSNTSTQIDIELGGGTYAGTNEIVVTNLVGSDSYTVTFTYDSRSIIPVGGGTDGHSKIQYALDGLYNWYGSTAFDVDKIIDIYGGIYTESITPNVSLSPTSGKELILQNHNGESPEIDASGFSNGVYIGALDYVTVSGLIVHSADNDNIYTEGDNNSIVYNKSYGSVGGSGIKFSTANSSTLKNNLVYSNYNYGIHLFGSTTVEVDNNTVYDNGHDIAEQIGVSIVNESWESGIGSWTLGGSWTLQSNNARTGTYSLRTASSSSTCTSPTYDISGYTDVDINFWDKKSSNSGTLTAEYSLDGGSWTSFSSEELVRNSYTQHPSGVLTLNGSTLSIRYTGITNRSDRYIYLDDITIIGNITASSALASLYIESGTGTTVENNIFIAKSGTDYVALETESGVTIDSDYNTYYKNGNTNLVDYNGTTRVDLAAWTGNGAGTNDLEDDPFFVNAGTDFHLQSTNGSYQGGEWPPITTISGTWTVDGSDSPALNSGNSTDDFGNEPSGGAAINQGCYGNTVQASLSGYLWQGTTSTDWSNTANWVSGTVPSASIDVTIPDVTLQPILSSAAGACNNLKVNSGATLTLNNTLSVAGDIENNGTITGSGTITLNGAASQQISGDFIGMSVNNASGITLGDHSNIDGVLNLSNGQINIGNYDLTLSSTSSITGTFSTSNMIVAEGTGILKKEFSGTGSFTFPVGEITGAAEYTPATLNFTSGTFTSAWAGINVFDIKHPDNSSTTDYITRYWSMSQNGISGFTCDISFTYTDADVEGTESNIFSMKYNGSWLKLNAANTVSNLLSGTVTSFSDATGGEEGSLPIELILFTAKYTDKGILIEWATASEINNDYVDIQRSEDAVSFHDLHRIIGIGNTNIVNNYSFLDSDISKSTKYYRLKQVDYDGAVSYSDIISVQANSLVGLNGDLFKFYPNPAKENLVFSNKYKGSIQVDVINVFGQNVLSKSINNQSDNAVYTFNISFLENGTYIVCVNTSDGSYYYRIVKQ